MSSDTDPTQHTASLGRRKLLQLGQLGAVGTLAGSSVVLAAPGASKTKPDASTDINFVRLGRTNLQVSDVSFGASRLRQGQESLVHHALARGINFFDSAETYTGGDSETVLGNAFAKSDVARDKLVLVSKMITRSNERSSSMMRSLEASLKRLRTDYIDIYFSHAVNNVDRMRNEEWTKFIDQARADGKIRFSGLSGHAGRLAESVDYAVDQDMVDVLLLAFNYGQDPEFYESITRRFDFVATQPEIPRLIAKAKAKDIGVVAMKTLMGARLNDLRGFEDAGATYAQAALRWSLSHQHVDAAIISMTSTALIDEYLGASGTRRTASTDPQDLSLLTAYARKNGTSYCRHACNDCSGACPLGVPIADVLRTRMYATDYGDLEFAKSEYAMLEGSAQACITCDGSPCAGACTHGLSISDLCKPAHSMLA